MITRGVKPTIATVISAGKVVGFLLNRGVAGTEAFDAGERSLGIFADARAGHAAVIAETSAAS